MTEINGEAGLKYIVSTDAALNFMQCYQSFIFIHSFIYIPSSLSFLHSFIHSYIHTGWSINNRTILNCSHFLARRYFFNPFSPKRSIHAGKLPQQHEFANAAFVILVRCHFVSPYHVDGSANNNVLSRGGHFCEIAEVLAH